MLFRCAAKRLIVDFRGEFWECLFSFILFLNSVVLFYSAHQNKEAGVTVVQSCGSDLQSGVGTGTRPCSVWWSLLRPMETTVSSCCADSLTSGRARSRWESVRWAIPPTESECKESYTRLFKVLYSHMIQREKDNESVKQSQLHEKGRVQIKCL